MEHTRKKSKMLIFPVDKIKCVRNQVLMVDLPLPSSMAPKQKFVSKLKRARTDYNTAPACFRQNCKMFCRDSVEAF